MKSKAKAVLFRQVIAVIGSMLPKDIKIENAVSEFVSKEFDKIGTSSDEITLLRAIVIPITNERPDDVLKVLMAFYNDIGDFYGGLVDSEASEPVEPILLSEKLEDSGTNGTV